MSGEYAPKPSLFDLDALDQNSEDAALRAEYEEFLRLSALPDHAEVMARPHLIQELDVEDAPLELKAANFLRDQAVEIVIMLHTDPAEVPEESKEFAARFLGTSDASREAILAAYDRYSDYSQVISWAASNNRTVAQAREDIAEFRAQPKPQFKIDPNLTEIPLRGDDPFQNAFHDIDFKVEGDDDWLE